MTTVQKWIQEQSQCVADDKSVTSNLRMLFVLPVK